MQQHGSKCLPRDSPPPPHTPDPGYGDTCYDIKPVRKEEGKSFWKIPLCDDDATTEK